MEPTGVVPAENQPEAQQMMQPVEGDMGGADQ